MSSTHSTPVRVRVERNLYVRPTGVFEAIYRDSAGKQRLRTLKATTLREARKELTALLGQRDRAEDIAPSRATLNDLADRFFAEYESKVARGERSQRALDTARQRYDTHVRPNLGLRRAQEIRSGSVSHWLADLRQTTLSNFTVRGIVTVLSAVFTQAVRDEAIQGNPVTRLKGSRRLGTIRIDPAASERPRLALLPHADFDADVLASMSRIPVSGRAARRLRATLSVGV